MRKDKNIKIIASVVLLLLPLNVLAQAVDPAFNPGKLIDDSAFSDTQTFGGAAGIQKFLETKDSVLADTSLDFLVKLKEPTITILKQGLEDPEPSLGRLRTAAELIWDASQSSGLNPQVILVTMEKEQGLIDAAQTYTPDQLQTALDHAMGFDCPDNSGCGDLFPGFYYQLFGNYDSSGNRYLGAARSLMKAFSKPGGEGPMINGQLSQTGQGITLENTQGGYDNIMPQQSLILSNNATAALYRYTPHVFNGNYNFWKYFNQWFKYQNGTLVALAGDVSTYIIEDGVKQLVPQFVAQARGLDMTSKITISPNEFAEYPTDKVFGPTDNTVVKTDFDGKTYVFLDGVKHPASEFVISQRGLSTSTELTISAADSALFDTGPVLPPNDGTVIKGQTTPAIYLVQNGGVELFSPYTFAQRKVTAKQIVIVPDAEISTYQSLGFVPPLDGTLVRASDSGTVYLMENGQKKPLTADVFKNRGFATRNIAVLSTEEVSALPIGAYATPMDRTFFAVDSKTGPLYEFKEGTTHAISSFVAKQRGITPDYIFPSSVVYEWFSGIPVPPRDGTLVKGQSDGTVYLVVNGQLSPLTALAFKNHHYRIKNIQVLPQTEVDSYPITDMLEN